MSVPLRKDEFDTEELTTADLAQGKRPAASEDRPPDPIRDDRTSEERLKTERLKEDRLGEGELREDGPGPVLARRSAMENAPTVASDVRADASANRNAAETTPLFPNNELDDLRKRWSEIQTAFVDEPRRAVEQADGLVASAMKRLAEVFAEERGKLEKQWDRGDNVSTEDLRVALQRYRSFFQRLLAV
jgi:hypothetical protein